MSLSGTAHGLATPPLPVAQPLVYITGSPQANKQCVAEYLALLLGDEAILIDHPYTSTWTPPPPCSTSPPHEPSPPATRQRPKGLRVQSSSSASSSSSSSTSILLPTTRSRAASTNTVLHHRPTPFFDPLLATISPQPFRTAILTDTKRSANPDCVSPVQAAGRTGRPLIRVRLGSSAPWASPPPQTDEATAAPIDEQTLEVRDGGADPHAVALRIVQLVKEINARRRGQGDWEAVNEVGHGDTVGGGGVAVGTGKGKGKGDCVCGVITPVLTPADEKQIRF